MVWPLKPDNNYVIGVRPLMANEQDWFYVERSQIELIDLSELSPVDVGNPQSE